eukprot:1737471-Rhodomonas_salina.4
MLRVVEGFSPPGLPPPQSPQPPPPPRPFFPPTNHPTLLRLTFFLLIIIIIILVVVLAIIITIKFRLTAHLIDVRHVRNPPPVHELLGNFFEQRAPRSPRRIGHDAIHAEVDLRCRLQVRHPRLESGGLSRRGVGNA